MGERPESIRSCGSIQRAGRYVLYDKIASGGMAVVRFGRFFGPEGFARIVAVKCLFPQFAEDPQFVSMFLDEARLATRIRSPHVVPALDVVAVDGGPFLVMEYVPGEPLSRLIRSPAPMPVPVAVSILCGVLRGLHAAHEARSEQGMPLGLVHRDVSPHNVLVGTDGLARLIDFGVAKVQGRAQTTLAGQIKGKLAYMAPEQLRSERVTRRTDVYAASVVLWEALTGQRLFAASDEGAIVLLVLGAEARAPSGALAVGARRDPRDVRAIERLDSIVLRGLDRDPDRRFVTALHMARALEGCVGPASPASVAAWLERAAGPALAAQARQVLRIENGPSPEGDESPASGPSFWGLRTQSGIHVESGTSVDSRTALNSDAPADSDMPADSDIPAHSDMPSNAGAAPDAEISVESTFVSTEPPMAVAPAGQRGRAAVRTILLAATISTVVAAAWQTCAHGRTPSPSSSQQPQ